MQDRNKESARDTCFMLSSFKGHQRSKHILHLRDTIALLLGVFVRLWKLVSVHLIVIMCCNIVPVYIEAIGNNQGKDKWAIMPSAEKGTDNLIKINITGWAISHVEVECSGKQILTMDAGHQRAKLKCFRCPFYIVWACVSVRMCVCLEWWIGNRDCHLKDETNLALVMLFSIHPLQNISSYCLTPECFGPPAGRRGAVGRMSVFLHIVCMCV